MRGFKKVMVVTLILNMCIGNMCIVRADESSNKEMESVLYDDKCTEIYKDCGEELLMCELKGDSNDDKKAILNEKCSQLNEAGIKSYIVDSNNYKLMEENLKIDFEDLGIKPQYTYLISENNDNDSIDRSIPSSEFLYTYNGTSYRMKYLTVTSDDDPAFEQAAYVNLLNTTSSNLIENCLNTAINAYISTICAPLGTVASICGLDISDFVSGHQTTLILHGGANWTRVYTLVYSTNKELWYRGSSVEYVQSLSHMSGTYYDATTNRMESVPENPSRDIKYSQHYIDYEWRKRNAVIYMLNSNGCNYDTTGSVSIYYGNVKKMTFSERF